MPLFTNLLYGLSVVLIMSGVLIGAQLFAEWINHRKR